MRSRDIVGKTGWLVLAAVVGMTGCASARGPADGAADGAAEDTTARDRTAAAAHPLADSVRPRHSVRPLVPTHAFRAAVERGTRTTRGEPGSGYWQQRVSYRIEAELNPQSATVQGEQNVVYTNNSPDTLRNVLMHLHQNAFAEGAQRVRRVPVTGGVTLRRVEVGGKVAQRGQRASDAGGPSYRVQGTLLWIDLARPLPPGRSLELELGWEHAVPPRGAPRTGHAEHEAFVVAQWYPQVAVYDDLRGWHDVPYWTNGEFYLEYADFDVAITVPEGWLVTATGELENEADVLQPVIGERLRRALAQDEVVHVVTAEDVEQRGVTRQQPGGQLTWQFRARDVRDFAFAASDRYVWDATRAVLPDADGDGHGETVAVNALYRAAAPGAEAWRDAARFMRHAVTFHARLWGPYLYPHITAAEGPVGGMEYPMLVFIGGSRTPESLYSVLSHEIAHEWWPMMVGSNESLYAWQDEGLVTYATALSRADMFEGTEPELGPQNAYLRIAGSDVERPVMTPPDLFGVGPQYGVAAYNKPGTLLRALGAVIGDDVVQRGLREYTRRWLLKHPSPYDLFNTFEDVAGEDLDWFWWPWFFETAVLDQAVADVVVEAAGAGERVMITVEDRGDAPMPVLLLLTLSDGGTREVRLPVEPWLAGAVVQTTTVDLPARLERVEIDAARRMPDVDRDNNVWVRGEGER